VRYPLPAELAIVPGEAQPPRLHRARPGVVRLLQPHPAPTAFVVTGGVFSIAEAKVGFLLAPLDDGRWAQQQVRREEPVPDVVGVKASDTAAQMMAARGR
jgi:hypothetical protein